VCEILGCRETQTQGQLNNNDKQRYYALPCPYPPSFEVEFEI